MEMSRARLEAECMEILKKNPRFKNKTPEELETIVKSVLKFAELVYIYCIDRKEKNPA